jgi:hypothetical protein
MPKTSTTYWNTLASDSNGRWKPIQGLEGGAEELTLSIDEKTGEYTRLTRFHRGAHTTRFGKSHEYPEEVFIVTGRLCDQAFGIWLETGHYASRPPGRNSWSVQNRCRPRRPRTIFPKQAKRITPCQAGLHPARSPASQRCKARSLVQVIYGASGNLCPTRRRRRRTSSRNPLRHHDTLSFAIHSECTGYATWPRLGPLNAHSTAHPVAAVWPSITVPIPTRGP